MRLRSSMAALVLAAAATQAAETSRVYTELQLKERAGVFTLFVPPEYPPDALANALGAQIDVFGTVRADGSFDLDRLEMKPDVPSFEGAVREAARFWMLRPRYDKACMPMPAPAQARIWMEVRDGKPVVAYAKPVEDGSKSVAGAPAPKYKRHPKIEYPPYALYRNIEGTIEVVSRVLPDGEVEMSHAVPGPLAKVFGPSIERGMMRAEFEPLGSGRANPVCVVESVSFRIKP